jgi:hypothetical protein
VTEIISISFISCVCIFRPLLNRPVINSFSSPCRTALKNIALRQQISFTLPL